LKKLSGKNQLQSLYLEMPHIQLDLGFFIVHLESAMSFIPWHRLFEDIHPFSRLDVNPRSGRQLSNSFSGLKASDIAKRT